MEVAFDEQKIRAALHTAWSRETAVQWTPENPASGQCNVTAAVIQDVFGGEIQRTRVEDIWHYYNRIDGRRIDFTDSQFTAPDARFAAPDVYADEPSDKAAAMAGIPQREYDALMSALVAVLATSD